MTNFEYLKTLSSDELADFLCMRIMDCNACIMKHKCRVFKMDGYKMWLQSEHKKDGENHDD